MVYPSIFAPFLLPGIVAHFCIMPLNSSDINQNSAYFFEKNLNMELFGLCAANYDLLGVKNSDPLD